MSRAFFNFLLTLALEIYAGMNQEGWESCFENFPFGFSCDSLDRASLSSLSSPATRSSKPAQSPGLRWRNSLAVGYQGVVSIACIQRQSLRWGSRIQTGLAMAPARWAMQVSVVMTRSSVASIAAV